MAVVAVSHGDLLSPRMPGRTGFVLVVEFINEYGVANVVFIKVCFTAPTAIAFVVKIADITVIPNPVDAVAFTAREKNLFAGAFGFANNKVVFHSSLSFL